MEEFNECINSCGLMDLPLDGKQLSWCNGQQGLARSWAKLDRVLINTQFGHEHGQTTARLLSRKTSDHSPIFLSFTKVDERYGPAPFRFQNMWTSHDSFLEMVRISWNEPIRWEPGLLNLAGKLKRLKQKMRQWNRETFGRVDAIIKELEEREEIYEEILQENYSEDIEQDLLITKAELDIWYKREDMRLAQQAKKIWLEKGDKNTKFFHATLAQRRRNACIKSMNLPDGTVLGSMELVHEGAVKYFEDFLTIEEDVATPCLEELIQPAVSENIVQSLRTEPTEKEIYQAFASIKADSSPGPDGFGSAFYVSSWSIIKEDVMAAVREFYSGQTLPRYYSSSFLVLIPKIKNPQSYDSFRPISLCNVIYKVFSKTLVDKLSLILDDAIAPEQGAFVKGRNILENITLTQEMVKLLHRKNRGGNILMKIDMSKAYDRVNWKFLDHTLRAFGLPDFFCRLIKNCVTSTWFSIMMHGTYKGFFKAKRGLRQGDPISPILFIIMEEVFSRLLKRKALEKRILTFSQPSGTPPISHLLFADDIMVFANASRGSIWCLMEVVKTYELWSGQKVNLEKSAVYFSKQLKRRRRGEILMETGVKEGHFPFQYLGVPIVEGKLKARNFDTLILNIERKLSGWKSRLLSQGGRMILMRHVLSSMPVYLLSAIHMPKLVIRKVHSLFANFFWGEQGGKSKRKWRSWRKLCAPEEEGGIGMRDVAEVQKSLFMKFGWNILTQKSLWANFFRAKYLKNGHIERRPESKLVSNFWKKVKEGIKEVLAKSSWKVREGNISLWFDNFLPGGPISEMISQVEEPNTRLKDLLDKNRWEDERIQRLMDRQTANEVIQLVGKLKDEKDVLVWLPEKSGTFSTKSAWNEVRLKHPKFEWAKWVWHKFLPKKIAICVWRAAFNCLSVDEQTRNIGIPIASACNCCKERQNEDLEHLLSKGELAVSIWKRASAEMGVPFRTQQNWKERVQIWFNRASRKTQLGFLLGLMPCVIIWKIWSWRCAARMEGFYKNIMEVWGDIKFWLGSIANTIIKARKLTSWDNKMIRNLGIHTVIVKKKQVKIIKWRRPNAGRLKLNVDGSSLGNPGLAGGGGILRDSGGKIVYGFSKHFGNASSVEAELRALLEGVKLCQNLGYTAIDIECDSIILVNWTRKQKCTAWYLWDYWEELQAVLQHFDFTISHSYREGNQVADSLARRGALGESSLFSEWKQLPRITRGLARLESMGTACFRCT
ncbi:uncharacterized protein LOC122294687 [Carya illinoinensis]|uniref:uncharacterized protein LOC122294687 n=1 Tax=Carya illinoinensis TaxID=32201 RepID=UPI001C7254F0|nr:uncharacterized protein LOC122294687 [Carya illinoinensis]